MRSRRASVKSRDTESAAFSAIPTQPDLSFIAGVMCRYISKWNEDHWKLAKHVLQYIRGTTDLCLTFNGDCGERILIGYADADWGGDLDTRRFTTGYVFKTFGSVVAWKSRRQATVALSTTEAEYMSSADCARQAIWLQLWLQGAGLTNNNNYQVPILNDNAGAIALSPNPVHYERSKYIGSEEYLAEVLTKGLPKDVFEKHQQNLGVTVRS
jgi:hypothetical protein